MPQRSLLKLRLKNTFWNCHHLHLDKGRTVTEDLLNKSQRHMQEKWKLMRDIKFSDQYSYHNLNLRMYAIIKNLLDQNCCNMRTFIDVDSIVGLTPMKVASQQREYWKKHGVNLQIGTQPLEGLETSENIELFETACEMSNFVGCLPSRDTSPEKHLDIAFSTAKRLELDIEAHLDQCNVPHERETELFCDFVEKYNYQGKARAIHCVSLSCQPLDYQHEIAKRMFKNNIGVIICPSAAISMTQHSEYTAPIHNSLGPVNVFLENNVNIGLGVDNIQDIFMPFCDGDFEFEMRLLSEAARIYDPDVLLKIAGNDMGFHNPMFDV